ncbi:hypothetical protein QZH41_000999 [Actinostola sp. cb2023]|nr:hypothetical protein QZH41_000999 [Actinostola sp. cb2023]
MFDPFMSIVPAVTQYSNDYTLFVPMHLSTRFFNSFVNIAAKTADLDKIKVIQDSNWNSTLKFSECTVVPGSVYSTCSMRLTKGTYRVYHQSISASFALITYGTLHRESYGFPAGLRITQPSRNCTASAMIPADDIDNDCDGRIDEEALNGIDDDGDERTQQTRNFNVTIILNSDVIRHYNETG